LVLQPNSPKLESCKFNIIINIINISYSQIQNGYNFLKKNIKLLNFNFFKKKIYIKKTDTQHGAGQATSAIINLRCIKEEI